MENNGNSELAKTENTEFTENKFISIIKTIIIFFGKAVWWLTKVLGWVLWQILRLILNLILTVLLPHKKDARFKSGFSKKMGRF